MSTDKGRITGPKRCVERRETGGRKTPGRRMVQYRLSAWFMILIPLCCACSARIWQTKENVSPSSYTTSSAEIERSVGKLRRLALLPIRYEYRGALFAKARDREIDALSREMEGSVRTFLTDMRGYDVVPLNLYEDVYPTKFHLSTEEVEARSALLFTWAGSSADGATPPEEVVHAVSDLGRPLDVDGLLLIQGHSDFRKASVILALTVATASLTWPLLALTAHDCWTQADMYEVSTGRIVWRLAFPRDMWATEVKNGTLFSSLEPAIPAVLTEP